jgi:HSP20 family protein
MSKLAIEKLSAAQPAPLQRLENVFEHVRKRAFELFEQRGGETGKDLQDWLNAEQEIVFSPPSELVEEDSDIQLRVAAPGFRDDQLRVSVSPEAITVEGQKESKQEQKQNKLRLSEFSQRYLLRQYVMPYQIDPDQVAASLQEGVLTIVAKKATKALPKPVAAESATRLKGNTSAA